MGWPHGRRSPPPGLGAGLEAPGPRRWGQQEVKGSGCEEKDSAPWGQRPQGLTSLLCDQAPQWTPQTELCRHVTKSPQSTESNPLGWPPNPNLFLFHFPSGSNTTMRQDTQAHGVLSLGLCPSPFPHPCLTRPASQMEHRQAQRGWAAPSSGSRVCSEGGCGVAGQRPPLPIPTLEVPADPTCAPPCRTKQTAHEA